VQTSKRERRRGRPNRSQEEALQSARRTGMLVREGTYVIHADAAFFMMLVREYFCPRKQHERVFSLHAHPLVSLSLFSPLSSRSCIRVRGDETSLFLP